MRSRNDSPPEGLALATIQQSLIYDALDRSPALVFVADDEMRYLAVNETACSVLGYTREELLGLHVPDVSASPDAPTDYRELMDARARRGVDTIRTKDGRTLSMAYRAFEVTVAAMPYFVCIGFLDDEV
ncbi:MAG: PAS domain S-box protein [Gaiellaceae bacterium]